MDFPSRRDTRLSILMYHSISDGPGPTCIPPATFRHQMQSLEEHGFRAISLTDFADIHRGKRDVPHRAVVITFDDGFVDFAENAMPELEKRQWSATVFIPTGLVGQAENWQGHQRICPRRLLNWGQIRELARHGIEFGGHSVTHCDLTKLTSRDLAREIQLPKETLEQNLGIAATAFAPPYGRSNRTVRHVISKSYRVSVGVRLNRASLLDDVFDLPRIEMHYFRDRNLWNAFVAGKAHAYFELRRALRKLRQFI